MLPEELTGLRRLYGGFMASRVVLTANNLGIFDCLTRAVTAAAVAEKLKADARAIGILLDALAGLKLVSKTKDSRYKNRPVSSHYLVKGSRLYQGDIVRHASSMWDRFATLDDVVKTGSPAPRSGDHEAFILGMHNLSVLRTGALIKAIGLRGVRTMLDLGGGPGTNALAMAREGVQATVFDRQQTIAIAKKVARREGAKNLHFMAGDFQKDAIGTGYDLILISQIFHAYSPEENIVLLEKCRTALNPGGRVVVQEFPINDALTAPSQSAIFAINMLVGTRSGRCYAPREMKQWLKKAGFSSLLTRTLEETVLVEGRKV